MALAAEPDNAMLANNLAYYYAERNKNLKQAEQMARTALKETRQDPNVADTLGWVLFKQNKVREAEGYIKDAVGKIPDNADLRYHLASVYAALGKKQQARIELDKALLLSPGHKESQSLLKHLN